MNDKYKVKIDTNDSRYVNLRKALKDDLSQKVQCEDYDKIINYIFALVFEHNQPKEEVKKEIEEIFQESADYIMDLLVNLLEKFYGSINNDNANDLIEEIYEEKAGGSKSLSSQVVNPNPQQEQKGNNKNLYNQAINNVKEGGRRRQSQNQRNKYDNYEDNYNQNYPNDRRNNYNNNNYGYNDRNNTNNNYNNYGNRRNNSQMQQNQRGRGSYNTNNNSNYDRNNSREENINVGGRNLIIKKRRGSKNSRSRSRSLERDRSKDRERNNSNNNYNNESGSNNNNNPSNAMENENHQHRGFPQQHQQQFNPNYQQGGYQNVPRRQYVNSNYFQPGTGPVYQPRRLGLFVARGGFPGRFVKQRFMDPMAMGRMPIMRKPFLRKAAAPVENNEGANTENVEKKEHLSNSESASINAPPASESAEHRMQENNNPQSQQADNAADDKTNKKKIRCRNWPNCKNQNCEYAHPTETCQYFPKCQFGSKCLYIHPNISCKYGFYCTRPGCSYSHGSGYGPGMFGMMPPNMQNFNANKFKKFPPKTGGKPGVIPGNNPSQENPEGEFPANPQENQMQVTNNEEMNIQS